MTSRLQSVVHKTVAVFKSQQLGFDDTSGQKSQTYLFSILDVIEAKRKRETVLLRGVRL